jgi:hypothetical protein
LLRRQLTERQKKRAVVAGRPPLEARVPGMQSEATVAGRARVHVVVPADARVLPPLASQYSAEAARMPRVIIGVLGAASNTLSAAPSPSHSTFAPHSTFARLESSRALDPDRTARAASFQRTLRRKGRAM